MSLIVQFLNKPHYVIGMELVAAALDGDQVTVFYQAVNGTFRNSAEGMTGFLDGPQQFVGLRTFH